MPLNASESIRHEEIARLAYLNWQKDGAIHGRDQRYWLEAEAQLKATKQLLVQEIQASSTTAKGARKTRSAQPKTPAGRKAAFSA
ncbi:MAG TPA: DUF2934 domain-containing protein [Candidatus Acidoferrum sp.]|nr:DUF2934 domain-containing protein [Candidatus Acidoferrum sp.]